MRHQKLYLWTKDLLSLFFSYLSPTTMFERGLAMGMTWKEGWGENGGLFKRGGGGDQIVKNE